MRKLKRWLGLLFLLLLLALAGFVIWASMSFSSMPEALAALQSDAQVQVEPEGWLIFRPVGGEPAVGLILYPGGRVEPRAYAPPARAIAEEKIAASRPLLPAETRWVTIEGGNHAQFGWYRPQSGDHPATISREAQQREVVAATLALLATLAEAGLCDVAVGVFAGHKCPHRLVDQDTALSRLR
jgi:hypothetical protein